MWFNHPEDTWSPAKVTTGGNEDISIEMVDGGLELRLSSAPKGGTSQNP